MEIENLGSGSSQAKANTVFDSIWLTHETESIGKSFPQPVDQDLLYLDAEKRVIHGPHFG